jgi:hypothetical protein
MSQITTMEREREYSVAAVKFNKAAWMFLRLGHRISLDPEEEKELEYMGDLFGEITSWEPSDYKKEQHPELCVKAACFRPLFYQAILETGITTKDYEEFSSRVYNALKSRGKQIDLSPAELSQTEKIFKLMYKKSLAEAQPHPGNI